MNANDVDTTVAAFQEAALSPERWPHALDKLKRTFGGSGAVAQMIGPQGFSIFTNPDWQETIEDYVRGDWAKVNTRMDRGLALTRKGRSGFLTEFLMFTPEELARDQFQQDFAAKHEMDAEAGLVVARHGGAQFVLTVPRGKKLGSYDLQELRYMNRLASMLVETCHLSLRLKLASAQSLVKTMSSRGEAIALLSPNGSVLFNTSAFERLLGDQIILRAGRVRAVDPRSDAKVLALIARTGLWPEPAAHDLKPVVIPRPSGHPLVLRCQPIAGAARDFLGLARTILIVDDLAARPRPAAAELVAEAFGLTPSESRLAIRLGAGESLREATDAESITYETGRMRLKSVFQKTGTGRQVELALLVARLL